MVSWPSYLHRVSHHWLQVSLCIALLSMMVHVVLGQTTTYNDPPGGYNGYTTIYDSGGNTGNYGNNENQIYNLNCNSGRTVVLFFWSPFTVVSGDVLSIYDGAQGTTQTQICGPCTSDQLTDKQKPLGMTGSSAVITFTSDGSGVAAGYKFDFQCADTSTALSGTIYDSGGKNGNIASPADYFQQIICPIGQVISLTFTMINLPGTPPQCTAAHLKPVYLQANSFFFNGLGTTGKYCGTPTLPGPATSPSNRALLYYQGTGSSPGYALDYKCQDENPVFGTLCDDGM